MNSAIFRESEDIMECEPMVWEFISLFPKTLTPTLNSNQNKALISINLLKLGMGVDFLSRYAIIWHRLSYPMDIANILAEKADNQA